MYIEFTVLVLAVWLLHILSSTNALLRNALTQMLALSYPEPSLV